MSPRARRFERTAPWGEKPGVRSVWGRLTGRLYRAAYAAIDRAAEQSEQMKAEAESVRRGSRKRSLPLMICGGAALVAMFGAVSQSALAVNFTTGNSKFKLYSNYLDAEHAAGYLAPTSRQGATDCDADTADVQAQCGVTELGIHQAKLAGLCGIATENIPLVGNYSLMITAGDDVPDSYNGSSIPTGTTTDPSTGKLTDGSLDNAISATNLYLNSDALSGYGNKISGMNLGQSAETVGESAGLAFEGNANQLPKAGAFGLYARQLNVAGLNGNSYGLNLKGNITLPDLNIRVVPGARTQADCS
ncbi:hypothetical protein G5C66_23665 [Nocardioides sp. KC13]|uniref:Cholesterol esterase n=1 Tax=Nocardioides turkmenicus TaxID=2711220 RepID=A0A6M1R7T9_9ACTN|nr:DUF6230 family protein [Nocardioides sp. KC13]NGN95722.1 hypothetical protein [Nocardioides sp. KC13]